MLLMGCSNFQSKELEGNTQTVELVYIAWACDCANWATPNDIEKFRENEDSLAKRSAFIEPADKTLNLPDTLGYNGDVIKFTGQFYAGKGGRKVMNQNKILKKLRFSGTRDMK